MPDRMTESEPRPAAWVRFLLAAMALAVAGVFAVAAWLRPYDADGRPLRMQTHTQLGLPPCEFYRVAGKPCPACGMTTSFSLLAHGDAGASLRANWAGTATALMAFAVLLWGAWAAARGATCSCGSRRRC